MTQMELNSKVMEILGHFPKSKYPLLTTHVKQHLPYPWPIDHVNIMIGFGGWVVAEFSIKKKDGLTSVTSKAGTYMVFNLEKECSKIEKQFGLT